MLHQHHLNNVILNCLSKTFNESVNNVNCTYHYAAWGEHDKVKLHASFMLIKVSYLQTEYLLNECRYWYVTLVLSKSKSKF